MPTGRSFHRYVNPQRDMPADAVAVHGLTAAFLADKPVFAAIVDEFLAFVGDAPAGDPQRRVRPEVPQRRARRAGRPPLAPARAIDTLELARRRFPGAQYSLDALCRRFGIDNSGRTKHGALLDSELLAEVYLELIGGRQPDLTLAVVAARGPRTASSPGSPPPRPRPLAPRITAAEVAAHAAFVAGLGEAALWPSS